MPTYEYRCTTCGYQFTVKKSVADVARPEKCPFCEHETTKRVWSAPAVNTSSCGTSGGSHGFG